MFTLAHLSDAHLAPLPQPRLSELVNKRITGYLNWQRRRQFIHRAEVLDTLAADLKLAAPDHIAVVGDLANIALPDEYPHGRDFLQSLGAPGDVTLVPGNHDVYVRAGCALAQRYWGAYMRGDDARAGFPFVRRRGPAALVGISTAVPTAPFLATGWSGARQLSALKLHLEALGREGLFRVVLMHHPPVTQAKKHKRLIDAPAFLQAIRDAGAELILHGHDHRHALVWLDGPHGHIPCVGVPSASASPGTDHDAAAYNLYRIDGDANAWRCEVVSRGFKKDSELRVVELGRRELTDAR
ncbi:MAG TPA: metallophosphoesterase [Pseudolabrys sp.]|nr:metallophosphoesterase [Pseudolabrys sp.]